MPDLVSVANWRLMSSSLLFLGPFKITSSSLTGSALSGKLSMAILAHGISTFPLKSKSFGEALTTTFGLTFNFAIDGISTLKLSAFALTSAVQLFMLAQLACPLIFSLLSGV